MTPPPNHDDTQHIKQNKKGMKLSEISSHLNFILYIFLIQVKISEKKIPRSTEKYFHLEYRLKVMEAS